MAVKGGIKYTKSGRIKLPRLTDPALKQIGDVMVYAQKDRWSKAINASGNPAKKLGVRYAIIKQAYLHKRPKRDMVITGLTKANFTLRKAGQNTIRAENTSRAARAHAKRANSYEQMIGFAGSDQISIFKEAQFQYGDYLQSAWVVLRK